MSNAGSVGFSSTGGSGSCGCVSVGSVDGSGSDAFGGVASVGLLITGGVSSLAGIETSDFASTVSVGAVLSAVISVLSETEIAMLSCGMLLCSYSVVTVSCEDGVDTSERSAFAQPERESASSTKTAMILVFSYAQTSFALSLYGSLPETAKLPSLYYLFFREVQVVSRGVRCGEGEHADPAVHPLKMGMAAPW